MKIRIVSSKDIAEHGGRLDPQYYIDNKIGKEYPMPRNMKAVKDIREGNRFVNPDTGSVAWTATSDAYEEDGYITVEVRWADGGMGKRSWDEPNMRIPILSQR